MDVTILIPTLNRSDYILRILKFYKKSLFTGQIVILDSSKKQEKELNKKNIRKYSKNLNIDYIWDIGWSFELLKKYQKYIKKNNCIFSGDDDFISIDGLKKSIEFLNKKKNKNIIATTGKGLVLGVYGKNFENFITSSEYRLTKAVEKNSFTRIKNYFDNYTVSIYSLCRTNIFKKILKQCLLKKNRYKCGYSGINGEILPCSIMVSLGTIHQIETPLIIRTVGHARFYQPNYYETINDSDFKRSKLFLIKSLSYSLVKNYNDKKCEDKIRSYLENYNRIAEVRHKKRIILPELKSNILKRIKNYIFFLIVFLFGDLKKSTNIYSIHYGFSWFSKDLSLISEIFKKTKIRKKV